MALSAAQIAQIYEIAGIPQQGAGYAAFALASLFGPAGEAFSFTAVCTALDARIAAVSASQETRIGTHLTRWDTIGGTSQLQINKSSEGAEGTIVDDPAEREAIRQAIFNLLGFICPRGGFTAQFRRGNGVSR